MFSSFELEALAGLPGMCPALFFLLLCFAPVLGFSGYGDSEKMTWIGPKVFGLYLLVR